MSADAGSAAEDGSVFRLPLQTERFFLEPLTPKDFNALYAVASDPLLWDQHPEADRWKRSKFQHFFQDGLTNDLGCFVIKEKRSGRPAGSTRFYGFDEADRCIRIGYTFIVRELWGTAANREIKEAMLTRAFKVVDRVFLISDLKISGLSPPLRSWVQSSVTTNLTAKRSTCYQSNSGSKLSEFVR